MGELVNIHNDGDRGFDPASLKPVVRVLACGGVAVLPTDTVYGVAQSVLANPNGPRRVFQIKRRDASKVVPWLVGSHQDLLRFGAHIPAYALDLARAFWPGGLTLVVFASNEVPAAYRAADGTVALRMPACDPVLHIVHELQGPLAATSANTSGLPAPVDPRDIEPRILHEADAALLAGPTPNALPSTIVACTPRGPEFTRVGALSKERIRAALS